MKLGKWTPQQRMAIVLEGIKGHKSACEALKIS